MIKVHKIRHGVSADKCKNFCSLSHSTVFSGRSVVQLLGGSNSGAGLLAYVPCLCSFPAEASGFAIV